MTALSPAALDQAALDRLARGMRGALIRPGDQDYDTARRVWNGMIDRYPAALARCDGTADVVASVRFAAKHKTLLAVRGGGAQRRRLRHL